MNLEHANKELLTALSLAQSEVENASKSSTNPHFKSRYADLAEVLNTVRETFTKHGLSLIQSTGYDGTLVTVTTAIGHSSGSYITSAASCVPAKADAQGVGAATTYLRRYALAAMCGIAQEDDDGNAASHSKPAMATTQQVDEMFDALASVSGDEAEFLKYIGAADRNLTLAQYNRGMLAINRKKAQATPDKPKKTPMKAMDELIENAQ